VLGGDGWDANANASELYVNYVFFKRGYLPAKLELRLKNRSASVTEKIVLQADPASPPGLAPNNTDYMREFERLRYLVADSDLSVSLSQQTLEEIWNGLEKCAEQALSAGDKHTAARIYLRMQYFPSLRRSDGNVYGFSKWDSNSPRGIEMFNRAIALNDGSAYFTAERNREARRTLVAELRKAEPSTKAELLKKYAFLIHETEQIIEKFGDQLWPYVYSLLASGYRHQLKDYNKA
jgi:hypothetical protein